MTALNRFFLQRKSQNKNNSFILPFGDGSFGFVVCSPSHSSSTGREIMGGSVQTVACQFLQRHRCFDLHAGAPLIFYSGRRFWLRMMDVSLTPVNGRKFASDFKCIAFLVLSKNTHFLGKTILEAFGITSLEFWLLMECEARGGPLMVKNHFLFLASSLDPCHITRGWLSSPSLPLKQEYCTEFWTLAFVVTFLVPLEGRKTSTVCRGN